MEKLKIMFLGYSGSGKTYLQGSFFKLASATGSKSISLQSLKFNEETSIQKAFEAISGQNQNTQIPTTVKTQTSEMVLKKGLKELFAIDLTDIEGQAIEAGRNVEVSKLILNQIHTYDGLILVIEYPPNEFAVQKAQQELGQLLNFAGKALEKNPQIPLTLVINKIDKVANSKQIKTRADEEISTLEQDLMQQYPNQRQRVNQLTKQRQGTIINKYVKPLVDVKLIWDFSDEFLKQVRNTPTTSIPAKVFVASSLGFGSNDDNNIQNYLRPNSIYKPYGGVAAFLWTIYARLTMQTTVGTNSNLDFGFPITELIDDLRSDLQELYITGQAYFDPDDNSPDNMWALRNSVALRAGIDN